MCQWKSLQGVHHHMWQGAWAVVRKFRFIKNDNSGPGFVGIRGSRRNDRKNFENFLYNSFVCSFARSFENFSNFSSRRRDRFGPKIVKFRAILAIFRPFEDFRNGAETKHLNSIRAAGPPKGPCSSNRIQMLQSSSTIWPFLFCIRIENFEGACTGQTFSKFQTAEKRWGWLRFWRFLDQTNRSAVS